MTIDANALAEELKVAAETWSEEAKGGLIVAAARELFTTLPRYKEVEVGTWVVADAQGRVGAFLYHNDADARDAAHERGHGAQAVRLTGTAKVKVSP